ncbi:hypothetical protein EV131_108277 [Rhizobium laguerreae]|uniref:Uncharacterized protein n=1 Tax=Rhizobium laguerreae TaxID=1076926 RepID=A0AAX2QI45_9HYPH|nr:hypothetical protein EV131_108277 [Rhizobium laguerreae]
MRPHYPPIVRSAGLRPYSTGRVKKNHACKGLMAVRGARRFRRALLPKPQCAASRLRLRALRANMFSTSTSAEKVMAA